MADLGRRGEHRIDHMDDSVGREDVRRDDLGACQKKERSGAADVCPHSEKKASTASREFSCQEGG